MTKEKTHTGVETHVATRAGYAEGRIILPGEFVPAGVPITHHDGEEEVTHRDGKTETLPISGGWMAPTKKAVKQIEEGDIVPLAAPVRNLSPDEHQQAREPFVEPAQPQGQEGPIAGAKPTKGK